MATVPFQNIQMAYAQALRACDVVIAVTAAGRGRIAIDRTGATPVLLAMGTDRRARDDDRIPGTLNGIAPGGIMAARGWPGDIFLTGGVRMGSRLWLLEDAKQDDAARLAAGRYIAEPMADLAAFYDIQIGSGASFTARGRVQVTATLPTGTVTAPVKQS
ncbi:hypothetical protein JCM25156A_32350 [Komagataeibacter kakiaceti JCM 25156]|uniref:phage GP46 family protein n=1 Tax=Komagataeibacter kakiaceti TaxID=943261 RepID=UPI000471077C|nr:phage GP46 family protein [Komagataeibacter kakiaceti]